jgi:hypothetical protein
MATPRKRLPVASQIRKGLEETILHARGQITLKTMTVEMPDRPAEVKAELRSPGPISTSDDRTR